jgi:hypothetical protein
MSLRSSGLSVLLLSLCAVGCRSKVATLRDALIADDGADVASVVDEPTCTDASCLDPIARALGAKAGFESNDPDQASAGAVAIVVARDKRGDLVPDADRWIAAMTMARGFGADALRLAVARAMAELAPQMGRPMDDEAEVSRRVHDLAGVMPGACDTYAMMSAVRADDIPPAKRPERSRCVQRDLERKDGPGATYGTGVWRAAAGAIALWKDEARALRTGLASTDPVARSVVEAKLAIIDAATARVELKAR